MKYEFKLDNYLWGSKKEDTKVKVKLENKGTILKIKFDVIEKELRRMVTEDQGPVWTDSCVELFISADNKAHYANFEFSASGAVLACYGSGRVNRSKYSEDLLATVKRKVTILENNNKQSHWILDVSLDLALFNLVKKLPQDVYINLYKCGDKLLTPHYLSAFPIDLEKPDFHTPAFFQKITLA